MNTDNKSLTSRERILQRVRANRPHAVSHPEVPIYSIAGNPLDNFINHVEGFDGRVVEFESREDAIGWLRENVDQSDSALVFSGVDGYVGNVTLDQLPSPGDAHRLKVSVGEGLLGIGETGSVLVAPSTFGRMANGLLAENLYLLLDRTKIVDGLQNAYRQMNLATIQYTSLFSGPSATADIEAVHITGAQGPVSLTILLY
ncbi:MAG: LUD domain-containing protein [Bacteroidales bacterium]|nr:LUD domain-containing protein [Bacteroidales bacterium]